jgi:quercetin dioxygenase-like cupin family protein
MIRIIATLSLLVLFASVSTEAQTIAITRGGSRPVRSGPVENFTGSVRVEMLFEAVDPSHASGGSVTFEPGARTAWHAHPRGQILIVTAGTGRVQRWGDPVDEIRVGDVVRIPAGQKHWHGASPNASMTHIAVSEHRDGTVVQWMEQVSDEQYSVAPRRSEGSAQAGAQPEGRSEGAASPQSAPRPSGPLQQKLAPGLATLTDDVKPLASFGDFERPSNSAWEQPHLELTAVRYAAGGVVEPPDRSGCGLDLGRCDEVLAVGGAAGISRNPNDILLHALTLASFTTAGFSGLFRALMQACRLPGGDRTPPGIRGAPGPPHPSSSSPPFRSTLP